MSSVTRKPIASKTLHKPLQMQPLTTEITPIHHTKPLSKKSKRLPQLPFKPFNASTKWEAPHHHYIDDETLSAPHHQAPRPPP